MRDPGSTALGGITLDVRVYAAVLGNVSRPPILQELTLNILKLDPPRFANDCPKDLVCLLPALPIQSAILL